MASPLSQNDQQRIADAVRRVEKASVAEIVPYVAVRSAPYPAARWRGGVLAAVFTIGMAGLLRVSSLTILAPYLTVSTILAAALGVGLLGAYVTGSVPSLTRALTPASERARAVRRRALQAFVEEEVFDTRKRTGVLLFVSLLEHRIEVLADVGIDRKVDESAWTDVTDHVRRGIEADRVTQGLLDGIECCGRLLDDHGIEARPDAENELADSPRSGERSPNA